MKTRNYLVVLLILARVSTVSAQEWQLDLKDAQKLALETDRKIVLVFSGSDWCAPCIKLDKEIWQSAEFQTYARENYVMLRADFPRKKANQLSEAQAIKNGKLAEKYNPNGYFPLVVILDNKAEVLGETGYKKMSPQEYISHLNSFNP
ncbi:thioredoxin family protein [Cyclobacterium jeungdonense]|uniref:Thioredoxin family protein n=1 Tax=Cyclobacterium jeungdonense TaxID=708087 RepID=A0ABT8CDM3_9BACT|nr:thioredoxin family protein [Cyclobacterium jeungdonense]MDN3689791.1 thioredoxin family protein [Cyclobacterium jeungdonense]